MTVREQKSLERERLLRLRLSLSEEERATRNTALRERIAESHLFREADLLLLFSPTRGEPDLLPLAEYAESLGKGIAFPLCHPTDHTMTFHRIHSVQELTAGRYGILAPPPHAPLADCTEKTLCLLPALSFDREGYRLGYGGGYYDRFLVSFPGHTAGPVYEQLLTDRLPREPHDQPVHQIITERRILLPNEATP